MEGLRIIYVNQDDINSKFKKMKELMDAGTIKFPTHAEQLKLVDGSVHFKPHSLCRNVHININLFDNGTRDGYKLNLITGKFYRP